MIETRELTVNDLLVQGYTLDHATQFLSPDRLPPSGHRRTKGTRRATAACRTWLRANGYPLSDKGRIPSAWVNAYVARVTYGNYMKENYGAKSA